MQEAEFLSCPRTNTESSSGDTAGFKLLYQPAAPGAQQAAIQLLEL